MREIKFRAWEEEKSVMRKVLNICFHGKPQITYHYNPVFKVAVEECIVEQFTGRYDSQGEEIFEGDIVKYSRTGGNKTEFTDGEIIHVGTIAWHENMCGLCFNYNYSSGGGYTTHGLSFNDQRFRYRYVEIIGNIHENPELLD